MSDKKPILRESLEVTYEDDRRETIIIKRLSNMDLLAWVDSKLNKVFLILRSVERCAPTDHPNEDWFNSLKQDSAMEVVEKALALNHSPTVQKKILEPSLANLRSFLSPMPSSS